MRYEWNMQYKMLSNHVKHMARGIWPVMTQYLTQGSHSLHIHWKRSLHWCLCNYTGVSSSNRQFNVRYVANCDSNSELSLVICWMVFHAKQYVWNRSINKIQMSMKYHNWLTTECSLSDCAIKGTQPWPWQWPHVGASRNTADRASSSVQWI